ncbi:proline-serine-threonine phosphatase-interacting protein 1-like isoform X1 [Ylistrum balloti]|uniref:proline-serine-threonine phosphatase-interacting protein 1-like isoform X1 n=1 Tax=Ylistrum balloti TaxID=509963 RepID=UPI002905B702|nr:proline-serine-threonine phosphatase-interacting protein 1-like isoform X1 [Ylistrum balloti]
MTKTPKFVESFWDADITSTRGSDVIIRRMKEGRKVCKELIEYLSERAKAEAAFAKSLKHAARKLEGTLEIGDLGSSIRALKSETEHIATAHETAGNDLSSLSIELSNFNKEQEVIKSQKTDLLQRTTSNKSSCHSKTVTLREKYMQKCRERDTADDVYASAKKSVATQTKDLMKAEKNKEKAFESMKHADTAYKSSVDTLEGAHRAWESNMAETCEAFQKMEEERIYLTRNVMWKITNVDSQACVRQDNCAEKVRQVLEKCDIETDLQTFIENYGVGQTHPEKVPYISYYERKGSQSTQPTLSRSGGTRPRQPLPLVRNLSGGPPISPPPTLSRERPTRLPSDDEDAYASISTTTPGNRMANVVRQHDAKIVVAASERL